MEPFVVAPGATLQVAVSTALRLLPCDHASTEAVRTALLSMREAALALE